jgi:hypothetical protein
MDIARVKEIRTSLVSGKMTHTWTELKEALLYLYNCYESTKKSLDEANTALQDAVADDMGEDLI